MGNSNMYKALSVKNDKIFTKGHSDNISHHRLIEVTVKKKKDRQMKNKVSLDKICKVRD